MKCFPMAIALALLLSPSANAIAQSNDHLQCYKIKDSIRGRVIADLEGPQFGLSSQCTISTKAREFCAPVSKTIVAPDPDLSPLSMSGQNLRDDRICYKVKCPKVDIPDRSVADQFGQRSIRKFKTSTICTPAVKVEAGSCGNDNLDPEEECDGTSDNACPGACRLDCTCPEAACTIQLPVTGQTICYDPTGGGTPVACAGTGQDGEHQAGASRSFSENGDGTITDNLTGLMWEKKDDNDLGGVHDLNDSYTFAEAVDPSGPFLSVLNDTCDDDETTPCTTNDDCVAATDVFAANDLCGHAGYRDWRLPNRRELDSIVDYEAANPAVSSEFHSSCIPGCSTTASPGPECSCTRDDRHWSSTAYFSNPADAWVVFFDDGGGDQDNVSSGRRARAVRDAP